MQIEKWSNETGEIAVILSPREYSDLYDIMNVYVKEHSAGDGTTNVPMLKIANKIARTTWGEVLLQGRGK